MRLSRGFRLRTLMVAVAVAGVALYAFVVFRGLALDAIKRPATAILTLATIAIPGSVGWFIGRVDRRRHADDRAGSGARRPDGRWLGRAVRAEREHGRATRRPWLPVEPDPPPPQ